MLSRDVAIRYLDGTSPNLPKVQQEAVWMDATIQASFGVTAKLLAHNVLRGHCATQEVSFLRWSPGIKQSMGINNPTALSTEDLKQSVLANF